MRLRPMLGPCSRSGRAWSWLLALVLAGCGVEIAPSGAFTCDPEHACPAGQGCIAGVCVEGDALADAAGGAEVQVVVEVVERQVLVCPAGACDDGNPCTEDGCDPEAGCQHAPVADATPCDDGSACTETDGCDGGQCRGQPASCDDGEPCTVDGCDPASGCTHAPRKSACDDGDPCTKGDACDGGTCAPGVKVPCDCVNDGDCGDLDDGDPCTGRVVCGAPGLPGQCTIDAATVPHCAQNEGPPCLVNTCTKAAGGCALVPVADGTSCDDGDACTAQDGCKGGQCAGEVVGCDDGKSCTVDLCDALKGCVHVGALLDGKPCDADGSACTVGDACQGGVCLAGAATSCDDGEVCTADGCDEKKGCTHLSVPQGAACDDGDACTIGESCQQGACGGGKAAACDDGNACTEDLCGKTVGCAHKAAAKGAACDDGDACTVGDGCQAGQCVGGKPKDCDDGRPCAVHGCDAKTGQCTWKPAADGVACGSGQGLCSGGACVATDPAGRKWGLVPQGTFFMGCNAALDKQCEADEKPQHEVEISGPFWMGLYEVTVAEYAACVAAGKCTPQSTTAPHCSGNEAKYNNSPAVNPGRAGHPVNCVDWSQAKAYCAWAGGFLPTEAQWELAARGRCAENGGASGCAAKMRVHPWGSAAPVCGKHAVFQSGGAGCGKEGTWPVGTGSALGRSPYGMADMAGSVWEWVRDWHASSYYQGAPKSDPENKASATYRVARGGGYPSAAVYLRSSDRGTTVPTVAVGDIGVRCARAFDPCDDANPCTASSQAKDGTCLHVALKDGTACDDGDVCVTSKTCQAGSCAGGKAVDCDDGNACTVDLCAKALGCVHKPAPKGTACDDGDGCTSDDVCSGMACKGGKPKSCDDGKPCTVYGCDAKTGQCTKGPAIDGTACGDGKGTCGAGACIFADGAGRQWGLVPAGTFFMGCNAALEGKCFENEKPQHEVQITKPFWMGLHEVTVAEYKACVDSGKCKAPTAYTAGSDWHAYCNWGRTDRAQHPVNCLRWSEASAFCAWAGGALPSEAQWQLAARGRCDENGGASGCAQKMRPYPWGKAPPVCGKHAVFESGGAGCGKDRTWPVGVGSAAGRSPYGMADMAGNVREWVRDWFAPSYYQTSPKQDPVNTSASSALVYCGGSFFNDAADVRAGIRNASYPNGYHASIGFRCVRPLP